MEAEQKEKNHKPGKGLCCICGEILLSHSGGGVNRENPMFSGSVMYVGRGEINVGLSRNCARIAYFAVKHIHL